MNTQTANGHEPKYRKLTRVQTAQLFNWLDGHKAEATMERSETLSQKLTTELGFPITKSQIVEMRQEMGIQSRVKRGPNKKPKRADALQILAASIVDIRKELSLLVPKELEELAKE